MEAGGNSIHECNQLLLGELWLWPVGVWYAARRVLPIHVGQIVFETHGGMFTNIALGIRLALRLPRDVACWIELSASTVIIVIWIDLARSFFIIIIISIIIIVIMIAGKYGYPEERFLISIAAKQ